MYTAISCESCETQCLITSFIHEVATLYWRVLSEIETFDVSQYRGTTTSSGDVRESVSLQTCGTGCFVRIKTTAVASVINLNVFSAMPSSFFRRLSQEIYRRFTKTRFHAGILRRSAKAPIVGPNRKRNLVAGKQVRTVKSAALGALQQLLGGLCV